MKRIVISAAAVAVLLGCDRKQVGHHHSLEITVTGVGQSWTNADGMVWTELKFDQKPDRVTPVYE